MEFLIKYVDKVTDEDGLCLHFEDKHENEFRWYLEGHNDMNEIKIGNWYKVEAEVLGEGYDTPVETIPHTIIENVKII